MKKQGMLKTTLLSLATAGLLFASVGCEDKQCKSDLQAAQDSASAAQKSLTDLQAENATLKEKTAQVDALGAQVAALSKELETLRAAAPAAAPAGETATQ